MKERTIKEYGVTVAFTIEQDTAIALTGIAAEYTKLNPGEGAKALSYYLKSRLRDVLPYAGLTVEAK